MKAKNRKCMIQPMFVVLMLLSVFLNKHTSAQEGPYWMGLSTKNPAAIGTPSDWLLVTYHQISYPYDQKIKGYGFFTDMEISPSVGTVGLSYMHEQYDDNRTTLVELSYAYTFDFSNKRELHVGLSGGLNKNGNIISGYGLDPGMDQIQDSKFTLLKTGLGTYYNSRKLDVGISYNFYSEMKSNLDYEIDYSMLKSLTVLSAYRFFVHDGFTVEPNVLFDFRKDDSDCYLGLHLNFDDLVWLGFNSKDWNELYSLNLGVDVADKRLRLAYSLSFSKRYNVMYDFEKRLTAHEFVLGFRLN